VRRREDDVQGLQEGREGFCIWTERFYWVSKRRGELLGIFSVLAMETGAQRTGYVNLALGYASSEQWLAVSGVVLAFHIRV